MRAIDGDDVADAAGVRLVEQGAEVLGQRAVGLDLVVLDQQHEILVNLDRLALLDDERAGEPAGELLELVHMRVIPVGAGVGADELVVESLAGHHRLLGERHRAVHGVVYADAVPMHRARLGEAVLEAEKGLLALLHPEHRPGHPAVVSPHGRLRTRRIEELGDAGGPGLDDDRRGITRPDGVRPSDQAGTRGRHTRQDTPTRHD